MSGLCAYRNILGTPGEGAHFHIGGVAIVDVLLTVIVAGVLCYFLDWLFFPTLLSVFVLAILLHWMFCVDTTLNRWLGLLPQNFSWPLFCVLVGLFVSGVILYWRVNQNG